MCTDQEAAWSSIKCTELGINLYSLLVTRVSLVAEKPGRHGSPCFIGFESHFGGVGIKDH